jgi:hypothetical protein
MGDIASEPPCKARGAINTKISFTAQEEQTKTALQPSAHNSPEIKFVATSADVFIESEKFFLCNPLCPPNMMIVCKSGMPSMT